MEADESRVGSVACVARSTPLRRDRRGAWRHPRPDHGVAAAFDASVEFDHDPLANAEEIQRSGEYLLRWLEALATSGNPRPTVTRTPGGTPPPRTTTPSTA